MPTCDRLPAADITPCSLTSQLEMGCQRHAIDRLHRHHASSAMAIMAACRLEDGMDSSGRGGS